MAIFFRYWSVYDENIFKRGLPARTKGRGDERRDGAADEEGCALFYARWSGFVVGQRCCTICIIRII